MDIKVAPTHSDRFTNAKRQLGKACQYVKISDDAQEYLKQPKTVVQASIPVRMDDASLQVFQSYRVRYNDTRGQTKGGLRYPSIGELTGNHCVGFWNDL